MIVNVGNTVHTCDIQNTDLSLVVKVLDETVGMVVLCLVEGRKWRKVVYVSTVLVPHVVGHTV